MEHPPKQGLKHLSNEDVLKIEDKVLMEHPPKQGLKPHTECHFKMGKARF